MALCFGVMLLGHLGISWGNPVICLIFGLVELDKSGKFAGVSLMAGAIKLYLSLDSLDSTLENTERMVLTWKMIVVASRIPLSK